MDDESRRRRQSLLLLMHFSLISCFLCFNEFSSPSASSCPVVHATKHMLSSLSLSPSISTCKWKHISLLVTLFTDTTHTKYYSLCCIRILCPVSPCLLSDVFHSVFCAHLLSSRRLQHNTSIDYRLILWICVRDGEDVHFPPQLNYRPKSLTKCTLSATGILHSPCAALLFHSSHEPEPHSCSSSHSSLLNLNPASRSPCFLSQRQTSH